MALTLGDNQKVLLSVTAIDEEGNVASNPTNLVFSSSDESVVTVADNGDGSAVANAEGPLGTVTITVDDTDPETPFTPGSLDIEVVATEAVGLNISAGTPEHN